MIAKIEDSSVPADEPPPSGVCDAFQIVLPYEGLFSFSVGRRTSLVDANHVLMVRDGGEEFADGHPLRDVGHAAIVVTPARWLLEELAGALPPARHPAFEAGLVAMSRRLRLIGHQLLRSRDQDEPLKLAEQALAIVREALNGDPRPPIASQRHIDRAKDLLHAYPGERLTLEQIAQAVGVSPVYLTQLFSRAEGMPLYRYQLQLRLNRALLALPYCEDITQLALELGFSSHSHFGAAFKTVFGMSPSEFRSGKAIGAGGVELARAA